MMESRQPAEGRTPRFSGEAGASARALMPPDSPCMRRRKLAMVVLAAALGSLAGTAGFYLIGRFLPLYRAEAIIRILPPAETVPPETTAHVQCQAPYGDRLRLASLLKNESMLQALVDPNFGGKVRQTRWFRETTHEDATEAVRSLEENLCVVPERQAPLIAVSMTCASAGDAALIATRMAELFISRQEQAKQRDEASAKLADLTKQKDEIEKDIGDREAALQSLRQGAAEKGVEGFLVPADRYFQNPITSRLNDLERQVSEAELAVKQRQAEIEDLKKLAEGPITDQTEHAIEGDPVLVSLTERLAMLQAQLAGQLTRFGDEHLLVRQTKKQIDEVEGARQRRQNEIAQQTRRANLDNAKDSLHALEERLAQLQQLRERAQQRQKALDSARAEYEHIEKTRAEQIARLNQVKAEMDRFSATIANLDTPRVEMLNPAAEPSQMVVSRRAWLWIPGGVTLGLLIGLAVVIGSRVLNDRVRTPSDVWRFLHLPLLGIIPDASEDHAVHDIDPYHVVREAPYSLLGEAYRHCRTNLDVSDQGTFKTLLIASGQAGEGKTTLACNLAAAFVAKSEKVLLIDANLRQPSLHLAFGRSTLQASGEKGRMGLTSVLTERCEYAEAIQPSRVAGLDLIYAGPPAANPAELLAGRRMKDLIGSVAAIYDRVIIDSPPVLLVSDVKVLARLADATLLVFNAVRTRRGAAQRTIFELQSAGARTIGCVLFGVRSLKGGYFRRQFKAYRKYVKPQLAASSA